MAEIYPTPSPVVYKYEPYPEKKYPPFTKRDTLFAALFGVSSFLLIDFGTKGFHFGFSIFYLFHLLITALYGYKKRKKPTAFTVLCGLLSLFAAFTLTVGNDTLVNFLTIILVGGLYGMFTLGITHTFTSDQGSFKICIDFAKDAFAATFSDIGLVFGSVKHSSKKNKKAVSSAVGVLVALPVVAVIVPLLIKSDAAFEGLMDNIAANIGIYLLEIFGALILLPYVFAYVFGKNNRKISADKKKGTHSRPILASGCVSFLAVISALYLVYLFSQLAYFFSAFKGILPDDYRYSASSFARRGFFEMFAICLINLTVLSLVGAFYKRDNKKTILAVKCLSLFISVFTVMLIVCAMQKMRLNISIFGLSENRVLVSVFMVMLLVISAFFVLHIFLPKLPYMQSIIIICSVIFVAVGFADIDSRIAEYNVSAYTSGKLDTIDVTELKNLGDGGIDALIDLTSVPDKKVSQKALDTLASAAVNDYGNDIKIEERKATVIYGNSDFRSYCQSHEKAKKSLANYYNSMSEDNKLVFNNRLMVFDNTNFTYDEDYGAYYRFSDDALFKLDKSTNLYKKQS